MVFYCDIYQNGCYIVVVVLEIVMDSLEILYYFIGIGFYVDNIVGVQIIFRLMIVIYVVVGSVCW